MSYRANEFSASSTYEHLHLPSTASDFWQQDMKTTFLFW